MGGRFGDCNKFCVLQRRSDDGFLTQRAVWEHTHCLLLYMFRRCCFPDSCWATVNEIHRLRECRGPDCGLVTWFWKLLRSRWKLIHRYTLTPPDSVAVFAAAGCLRLLHIRFLRTPGNFANGSLQQNALSSMFISLIRWFLPLLMLFWFAHNP